MFQIFNESEHNLIVRAITWKELVSFSWWVARRIEETIIAPLLQQALRFQSHLYFHGKQQMYNLRFLIDKKVPPVGYWYRHIYQEAILGCNQRDPSQSWSPHLKSFRPN